MTFRRFGSSTQRGYNLTCLTWNVTWFHVLINDVPLHNLLSATGGESFEEQPKLQQRIRLESSGWSFSWESKWNWIPSNTPWQSFVFSSSCIIVIWHSPQRHCSLQRLTKCLLFLVVITPHYKNGCLSLQEAGVVPACDVPGGPLEKYLQNNFTLEQIVRLFCVSSKTSPTTYYWISTRLWKTQFSNRRRIGWCYVSMNSSIVVSGIPMLTLSSYEYRWICIGSAKFMVECYFQELTKWHDFNK